MVRLNLFLVLVFSFACINCDDDLAKEGIIEAPECHLPPEVEDEIISYAPIAWQIIEEVILGNGAGRSYDLLKYFVTNFYHRPAGSEMLEDAIDYFQDVIKNNGLEVDSQNVTVPHWQRGEESAELLEPRKWKLNILALGNSVATPDEGIEAEAVVYRSLDELITNPEPANGKIVIMYNDWINYDYARLHRTYTASEASKAGAVAALVRSATPYSLQSPHTGDQVYLKDVVPIPVATLTIEDAEMLYRLFNNGSTKLIISLKMIGHANLPDSISRNSFGKLVGDEVPYEKVVLCGHIDSWDVGEGALDDMSGVATALQAVITLKDMGLTPRRSIEAIAFTAEEVGYQGVDKYIWERGEAELPNIVAAFEADWGFFRPLGFDVAISDDAYCIVDRIMDFFEPLNATLLRRFRSVASDVSKLREKGNVPSFSMNTDDARYFWYHHSNADTLPAVHSGDLDIGVAMYAVTSYILADMAHPLPRFDD